MSLQIVYGRAGTGKTKFCFQEIKKNIKSLDKIYMITPEQFSYMQEKRLLASLETEAVLNAEVITFNRMLDKISIEVGGIYEKLITKSARAMLMHNVIQENKEKFTFLNKSDENIDLALKTITEFKKHNVATKDLEKNISQIEDINLKLKLSDMLEVYKAYTQALSEKFIDEDDKLTLLSKLIEKSTMFCESLVFVDEFAGFTSQEYEILKQIMKKAKKTVITACMDYEKDEDIFIPNKQVVEKLLNLAKEASVEIEEPIILKKSYRFKTEELTHLEKNIYENKFKKYDKNPKNLYLFLASNPYSEIEYVAKQIIKLVRDEKYEYRDISIITKNIDSISSIAKAVFKKYGIPIYMDEKDELSGSIAVKYILSVLEIFSKNWSAESVINYAKLGFTTLEKEEIYKLENYAKKWGIRGSKWYKEDFKFGDNLDEINSIRKILVEPLLKFKENLNKQKTVEQIAKEIYLFLEDNNFYYKLNEKISSLEKEGELKLASDYKQSVESLISILDEMVLLFPNKKISFEKFNEIFKVGLKSKEIGSIPQTLDQVVLGDVDRTRSHKVKACFIIGVNDGVFPSINKNEGFFNDNDRETLKMLGTELAKGTNEMLYDEEFNIYKALTTAEEKLYLSYVSQNIDGAALRASNIITKIKKIFPNLIEESDVTKVNTEITVEESTFNELLYNLRQYKDGEKIDDIWFEVYNWYEQNSKWKDRLKKALEGLTHTNNAEKINIQNVESLYGKTLKTSISKLEKYQECPFSYHLRYGLNLKEAEEFQIKSIDTGSFMHDIVDTFFEEIKDGEINKLTKEDIEDIVNSIIDDKLELKKNAIFTSSPKFIVLTNRLKKVITQSITYIVYQLQNSNFEILGNEVEFSEKQDNVEIVGKIDRLDSAENEEGSYIRIIDYKSSNKNLDLNKMVTGLQIQLLTYIDVMAKKTNKEPVGMLYFNLIDPIISKNKNLSDEEIEEEIRKAFKMKGLILSDIKIVKMMDNSLDAGSSNIIPVTLDKSGDIMNSRSSVITKEEFTLLQAKIKKLIKQISNEILSGKIEIKPTYSGKEKKSACEYCPYKTICGFNPKENSYSYVPNKTKDEIFENLKKEN